MGYRFSDNPPKPEDHLRRFPVRNGAVMRLAFACYYMKGHNPDLHDHLGWPNPDYPDTICQERSNMRLFGMKHKTIELEEIDLIEEGYDSVQVTFEDDEMAQHLSIETWIDEDDPNIVRLLVFAGFPSFSDKPIDVRFTLFVSKSNEEIPSREMARDAVCHGVFTILPGNPSPPTEE